MTNLPCHLLLNNSSDNAIITGQKKEIVYHYKNTDDCKWSAKLVQRLQAGFAVLSYLVDGPERVKRIWVFHILTYKI